MNESAAHGAAEGVVRDSYGRLVAYLAARTGDVAGAEDALGDALAAALQRWPVDGVPQKPEAWLLRAARNRLIDAGRHDKVIRQTQDFVMQLTEDSGDTGARQAPFPDERLKLLFVCAHPAIDPSVRTPIMLQAVLGLDSARIASAFLVSPAAMGQRLVRAKTKIRDAGIPFRVPDPPEWDERVSFVLDAIYSAYTAGWDGAARDLAAEAISLGRTLAALIPREPEALGLLSLMLHCEARTAARHSAQGEFVPLDRQDAALWSRPMIGEAEGLLRAAAGQGQMGRFQLEAAIQSLHAQRAVTGNIDWKGIALIYEGLVRLAPSVGAQVGRAVALAEAGDAGGGLAALGAIPQDKARGYQPWWAARAHLLELLGRPREAREAFHRAAALTEDAALRAHLLGRAIAAG
ncbi:MAG TPA: DUF6596 domain-containing protein [Opitutaceae bacterium]|jgi:RNA polymerase sigma-70 factor (ECF subfamily)